MHLPHHPDFPYRRMIFVTVNPLLAGVALVAVRLSFVEWIMSLCACALLAGALYYVAEWLARLDARTPGITDTHALNSVLGFYAPLVGAGTLLGASPWLLELPGKSAFGQAALFLAMPCAMAVAAGVLRGCDTTRETPSARWAARTARGH